ncbi:MAG: hypothetical protein R3A80_10520 [Bdellovibrionota bacterium]
MFKKIFLLSFVCAVTLSASELRSKEAKEVFCKEVKNQFGDLAGREELCLSAVVSVNDSENTSVKIGDDKVLTSLSVQTTLNELSVKGKILRRLVVNEDGSVKPAGWASAIVYDSSLSALGLILNSWTTSDNVSELESIGEGHQALKKFVKDNLDPDADESYATYYEIRESTSSTKVVGYIITIWSENEEEDIKSLSTSKFDLSEKQVGETSEESWGYNE